MNINQIIGFVMYLAASAVQAAPFSDLSSAPTGRIDFVSNTPEHRWALIRGRLGPEVTVFGDLLMPKDLSKKVPAIVLSHGSDGVTQTMYTLWAKTFTDAGYAVFIVDSFSPRGKRDVLGPVAQLKYDHSANTVDALNALKLLTTHPNIDAQRIFHMGWSRGGSAVFTAAWRPYQNAVLPLGVDWAGSIAFYPGCNIRYLFDADIKLTHPLIILQGEKDNMTPAKPCEEYARNLAAEGNPVTYKSYSNAYHVFDRLDQAHNNSRQGTYGECAIDIRMPVPGRKYQYGGVDRSTGVTFTTPEEFLADVKKCETVSSITSESNNRAREQSVKDVLEFVAHINN